MAICFTNGPQQFAASSQSIALLIMLFENVGVMMFH